MAKLTKQVLTRRCGLAEEEALFILNYQKKIPILLENDGIEGFCVDVRDLYKQLLQTQDINNFARWIKRAVKNYKFEENVDFSLILPTGRIKENRISGRGGDNKSIEYYCTIDMAKELAMVQKNDIGRDTRRYFLLMEKAVKKLALWNFVREPLKKGYTIMDQALNEYIQDTQGREADKWDYCYEADMINVIATGFTAKQIKSYVGALTEVTRDNLTEIYNSYLLKMQELNTMYIRMGMNRLQRCAMLLENFKALYPDYAIIKTNATREEIENNKQKLLEEIKSKF